MEPTIILEKNTKLKQKVNSPSSSPPSSCYPYQSINLTLYIYNIYLSIYIAQAVALERYNTMLKHVGGIERLLSGSDDFTMFLWEPTKSKKSLTRMTGHGQLINVVSFSPDGRLIASASFDKSIKLWNAITGV